MGPQGEREKSLTSMVSNPRSPEQITVALPTELQGQMGAGRGKLRYKTVKILFLIICFIVR